MLSDLRKFGSGDRYDKIAIMWSRFGPYHIARINGLCEALADSGDKVIGIEVAQQDHYEWETASISMRFERRTLCRDNSYSDMDPTSIAKRVTDVLDELCPDVLAINGWSVSEARAALSWRKRHRKSRAILMTETKQDDATRVWWRERAKGIMLGKYDAALVGGRMQAEYLRRLGFPEERIFLGYDSVDNDYFEEGSRTVRNAREHLWTKFLLPQRYFLSCTRFLARKNVDGLLRAYSLYRERTPLEPWGLVVLGSGECQEELHETARRLKLDATLWPGFVQYDQLPVYYGLASAFIHPAKSEAWGLVVNEAAASGLPLLVSRTVGARYELVKDGENGLLFDPYSVEDMASAMKRVADMSDQERLRMGRTLAGDRFRLLPAPFRGAVAGGSGYGAVSA